MSVNEGTVILKYSIEYSIEIEIFFLTTNQNLL